MNKARILSVFLLIAILLPVEEAMGQGLTAPRWRVTVKVVDESGNPLEGARVELGYHVSGGGWSSEAPSFDAIKGTTGSDGLFSGATSSRSNWGISIRVNKPGYYESYREFEFDTVRLRRWRPWNPTVEMLLKERKDPIAMYAKRIRGSGNLPVEGEPVGFDLSRGDWVRPHGDGERADLFFHSDAEREEVVEEIFGRVRTTFTFDGTLFVSFPNEGDGMLEFRRKENDHSRLVSSQIAPEGGYVPEWSWVRRLTRDPNDPPYHAEREDSYDEDRHFYIRVRTELDPQGNVIRANYGKFYGDIWYQPQTGGGSEVRFEYYLNPEPNDRRMEFDNHRNLLDLPRIGLSSPYAP